MRDLEGPWPSAVDFRTSTAVAVPSQAGRKGPGHQPGGAQEGRATISQDQGQGGEEGPGVGQPLPGGSVAEEVGTEAHLLDLVAVGVSFALFVKDLVLG